MRMLRSLLMLRNRMFTRKREKDRGKEGERVKTRVLKNFSNYHNFHSRKISGRNQILTKNTHSIYSLIDCMRIGLWRIS